MLDRSLEVIFVRELGEAEAIVSYGGATSVVPMIALSRLEA